MNKDTHRLKSTETKKKILKTFNIMQFKKTTEILEQL